MPTIQLWIDDTVYQRLVEETRGLIKNGREKPINTYIRNAIVDRLNRDAQERKRVRLLSPKATV